MALQTYRQGCLLVMAAEWWWHWLLDARELVKMVFCHEGIIFYP